MSANVSNSESFPHGSNLENASHVSNFEDVHSHFFFWGGLFRLLYMSYMTHSYVRHALIIGVTCPIHVCDMTRSHAWQDLNQCHMTIHSNCISKKSKKKKLLATYTYIRMYTCVYIYKCIYICLNMHARVCVCICKSIGAGIHTHFF